MKKSNKLIDIIDTTGTKNVLGNMYNFKKYRRTNIAEMRPFDTENETLTVLSYGGVSISDSDIQNGSPKEGDMIARNPENHSDQWLVAKEYFENNFEEIK